MKCEPCTCLLGRPAGCSQTASSVTSPSAPSSGEPHACEVLRQRAAEGWFPGLHVHEGDVRLFDPSEYAGRVDCIHAGFPCQDVSSAGKRAGVGEGTRSGLYREVLRVADAVRPRFLFLENVAAIAAAVAGEQPLSIVAGDLAARGYHAVWARLAASDVGAPHQRNRWWCLAWRADADGINRSADCGEPDTWSDGRHKSAGLGENVADPDCDACHARRPESERQQRQAGLADGCALMADTDTNAMEGLEQRSQQGGFGRQAGLHGGARGTPDTGGGPVEPDMGRMADGLASQMDVGWWMEEPQVGRVTLEKEQRRQRLMELGNGQVPLQAAAAFMILWEMMEAVE